MTVGLADLDRTAEDDAGAVDAAVRATAAILAAATPEDEDGFPSDALDSLARAGLAMAPFPVSVGGRGLMAPDQAGALCDVLRLVGRADLALGRLYEGHVNAVQLVARYGTGSQLADLAVAVRAGAWSGVWNAEGRTGLTVVPDGGRWRLDGRKILCSGAGWLTRPLVVGAWPTHGVVMTLPRLEPGERADLSAWTPQGMRSTATGTMDFSGLSVGPEGMVGLPGDYLREPSFKGGAWRFCAVQLGGMERLIDLYRLHLRSTDRGRDHMQLMRFGQGCAALLSAGTTVRRTAEQVEGALPTQGADAVALVGLARHVTERAGMEIIDLVQRGIGLRALMRPNVVERVTRDLSTYLRQPGPDAALLDAGIRVLDVDRSTSRLWSAH